MSTYFSPPTISATSVGALKPVRTTGRTVLSGRSCSSSRPINTPMTHETNNSEIGLGFVGHRKKVHVMRPLLSTKRTSVILIERFFLFVMLYRYVWAKSRCCWTGINGGVSTSLESFHAHFLHCCYSPTSGYWPARMSFHTTQLFAGP